MKPYLYKRERKCFLLFFAISLFVLVHFRALADISDCFNPIDLNLSDQSMIRFCEIPPAIDVLIGNEREGETPSHHYANERPVKIRDFHGFHIAQFEVTQAQYKIVMDDQPWKNTNGSLRRGVEEGASYPAVYVTHDDAKTFAAKLSGFDSKSLYRLPTEAEWEYSARGGTNTSFYWGDEFDRDFAYYGGNSGEGIESDNKSAKLVTSCPNRKRNSRHPGYCANQFGLMHMLGNVREWVADSYKNSYLNAPVNGHIAVQNKRNPYRVVRGGSFVGEPRWELNSSRRWRRDQNEPGQHIGFRVVRLPR